MKKTKRETVSWKTLPDTSLFSTSASPASEAYRLDYFGRRANSPVQPFLASGKIGPTDIISTVTTRVSGQRTTRAKIATVKTAWPGILNHGSMQSKNNHIFFLDTPKASIWSACLPWTRLWTRISQTITKLCRTFEPDTPPALL